MDNDIVASASNSSSYDSISIGSSRGFATFTELTTTSDPSLPLIFLSKTDLNVSLLSLSFTYSSNSSTFSSATVTNVAIAIYSE